MLKPTTFKFEWPLQTRKLTDDITRILRCGVRDSQIQIAREGERKKPTQSKDRSNYICRQVQRQKHRRMWIDLV